MIIIRRKSEAFGGFLYAVQEGSFLCRIAYTAHIGTDKDHRCETSDKMQAFTLLIRLSQKNT